MNTIEPRCRTLFWHNKYLPTYYIGIPANVIDLDLAGYVSYLV